MLSPTRLRRQRERALAFALSLPLLLFLTVPLLALFLRAPLHRIPENLSTPQVRQAIRVSMETSLTATALTVLTGTPVAYLLARHRLPLQRFFEAILDMPLVLPPAVAGVALLMAFGRRGLLGDTLAVLGVTIAFTEAAVILAQMFVAAPFYVRAARLGFGSVGSEVLQAAQLDGASVWQAFRFVLAPLAWTALLSGAIMTWARALGEFGATIIFAGNFPGRTQTMPLAIYIGFELDLNTALTISVILVSVSFLVLLVVRGILHREVESVDL